MPKCRLPNPYRGCVNLRWLAMSLIFRGAASVPCAHRHKLAAVERLCDTGKAQQAGATTAAAGAFKVSSTVCGEVLIY